MRPQNQQPTSLPSQIASLVNDLKHEGFAVWLFGSRANGTEKPDSDWDLLVFGDWKLALRLSQIPPVDPVDLLVVLDGDHFESPWNKTADGNAKSGSLTGWEWRQITPTSATYSGTKWPNDWGSPKRAYLL